MTAPSTNTLLVTIQVQKYQGVNPSTGELVLTAGNQTLLLSVPLVGSIVGALLAFPLNNVLGRKWPLLLAYITSIGGTFIQIFSPNIGAFVAGRFIVAIALGIANATAPLYLSEVVPVSIRGRVVSSINVMNLLSGGQYYHIHTLSLLFPPFFFPSPPAPPSFPIHTHTHTQYKSP